MNLANDEKMTVRRYNSYKSKWIASIFQFIDGIYAHLYGIITIVSFIVALVIAVITLKKETGPDIKDILYILVALIAILSAVLITVSIKYSSLYAISRDLINMGNDNDQLNILIKQQSETFHNITHYYRNRISQLDEYKELRQHTEFVLDNKFIHEIAERNYSFLILIVTSIQNYFSNYTDDNCSVTLKLLDDDKTHIQTLFRDPVNLKKRRQAERSYLNNNSYLVSDNTAFEIITDEQFTNIYFASDNLVELYENHNYKNMNPQWFKLYNSTVVVPISMLLSRNSRKIVGFITVDNFKGNLADDISLEFLFGIGDLLYNWIVKMKEFTTFAHSNHIYDEKFDRFIFRGDC